MTQGKQGPARELKQHQPTDENLEVASELAIENANDSTGSESRLPQLTLPVISS